MSNRAALSSIATRYASIGSRRLRSRIYRESKIEVILNRIAVPAAFVGLLLYVAPFLILQEDSYFTVHDNLDSNFVHLVLLSATGTAFDFSMDAEVENVMNGLPRSALTSGMNVVVVLFQLFEPHTAYIVNSILIRLVALVGMYLLLTRFFLKSKGYTYIAAGVSLLFAVVPFYSLYGLSVAGQPLLLFAFLNLRREKAKFVSLFIIAAFPFYAYLAFTAPFFVTFLLLFVVYDLLVGKKVNYTFILGIFVLCVSFVVVDYQMFYDELVGGFVSHRSVWPLDRYGELHFMTSLSDSVALLLRTQYHTGSFPTLLVLGVSLLMLGINVVTKDRIREYAIIIASIVFICLVYGFYTYVVHAFGEHFGLLIRFQGSRFYALLPLLWMLLLAIALRDMARFPILKPLIGVLLIVQLGAMLNGHWSHNNVEFKNNARKVAGRAVPAPTFRQFFAAELFAEIDAHIGVPKSEYRVVSIGMHPSIAQFNGFYTLDSYQVLYELEYKNAFRAIIADELEKSPWLKEYFDEWGNRCYVFSAELGYGSTARSVRSIEHLSLNTRALRRLGGAYVLSSLRIENSADNALRLEKIFDHEQSGRTVYLYEVLPETRARAGETGTGAGQAGGHRERAHSG